MSRTDCTRWFMEPLNSDTNEVISVFLNGDCSLCQEKKDKKGKTHKVWECLPEEIRTIESEQRKNGILKFRIMNSAGRDRPVRVFPFKFLSRSRKNKKPSVS